jgi:hypothetical protein
MSGKDVSILAVDEAQQKLLVDCVKLVRNRYVSIEEIGFVGGVRVFVCDSSNGGDACSGAPFVMSFPNDAAFAPRRRAHAGDQRRIIGFSSLHRAGDPGAVIDNLLVRVPVLAA